MSGCGQTTRRASAGRSPSDNGWEGIETRETPRWVGDQALDTFELVEWGEQGDRSIEVEGSVYPLSAWLVDREHLIAIEIDFGDGASARYP